MPRWSPIWASTSLISFKRFAPEIRGAQHLGFGLLNEVADIDDVVVLQAIGRAYRKLQLVDLAQQVLVERQLARADVLRGVARLLEIDEELQLILQDAGSKSDRVLGGYRAIGLDPERQPVVIRDLAHAGILDPVGDLANRAEERIDRNEADRRVLGPILRRRDIALTVLDGQLHRNPDAAVERADHQFGVHDVDIMAGLDRAGTDFAGSAGAQPHALGAIAIHPQIDGLDVEDDVGHVLEYAGERREFVQYALDLHRGDRRTLQRRHQHPPQRISQCQPEAALQRLGDDRGDPLGVVARLNRQLFRFDQCLPISLKHSRTSVIQCGFSSATSAAGR